MIKRAYFPLRYYSISLQNIDPLSQGGLQRQAGDGGGDPEAAEGAEQQGGEPLLRLQQACHLARPGGPGGRGHHQERHPGVPRGPPGEEIIDLLLKEKQCIANCNGMFHFA